MSSMLNEGETLGAFLDRYRSLELLRFLTCGSVDDGKSTLIGRLLYDTDRVYDDHRKALEEDSKIHGTQGGNVDLALLVDGLKAEREQGITIDVAWRYFATLHRSFIIADCPGHEQYTRNMATGASHCQLAITLIDARHGMTRQTRRHAFIAALLGLPQMVAAVNKMDLVGWDEARFRSVEREFLAWCARLGTPEPTVIPISALHGDCIVHPSTHAPWYRGPTILQLLESVPVMRPAADAPLRLPVQQVLRPSPDFRGFAGRIESGSVTVGDRVQVLPSGRETRIARIACAEADGGDRKSVAAPGSVLVTFTDEVDCSRGDVITCVGGSQQPIPCHSIEADLVWMDETPLMAGASFLMRIGTRTVPATVVRIRHVVDVDTLAQHARDSIEWNEVGRVDIVTQQTIVVEPYRQMRALGALILIDRVTHATAAAGMVRSGDPHEPNPRRAHWATQPAPTIEPPADRSATESVARAARWRQRPAAILLFGPPKSGKTRRAFALERHLWQQGHAALVLDGQALRGGLSRDLTFSDEDRSENLRRAAEVTRLLLDQGMVVILSMVAPQTAARELARDLIGADRFLAIDCAQRGTDDAALFRDVESFIRPDQTPGAG
ncbi:MAG: adenylyl-sulfate kinase [Planctomycetes bacterium]|nr:adenylyl-sulfate kinase [Planctomycetota bacterium]